MEFTSFVPEAYIEVINERLTKFVRRCVKKGLPVPVLTLGITENRTTCYKEHAHEGCPQARWQEVTIAGDEPRIGAWSLVASVDNLDGVPFFRPVPGAEVPVSYRDADPTACDYCKASRYRTETFIVFNNETHEHSQVGRQCIKDFLGWDISTLTAFYGFLSSITDEPEGGYGSYVKPVFTPNDIIRLAANIVAVDGYYIKSSELQDSTKSKVMEFLFPPMGGKEVKWFAEFSAKYARTERATEIYDATITEIDKLDTSSDWAYNVSTAASADSVGTRQVGILASAVILGLRVIEQKASVDASSEYIGNIGDKLTLNVEVRDIRPFSGQYGDSNLITFATSQGTIVKWFATGRRAPVAEGDIVTLTGTVKKHEEYRGTKSTMLTRCKVQ